ncbi:MAG: Uma2 family endonuclease [Tepidisphaeraceae bacterium]
MLATSKHVRFTVDEYFRMSEAGVFDGRRVELIEGRIVPVHAQANPHRAAVTLGGIALLRAFPKEKFWVVVQGTLRLGQFGAPDPDFHVFDVPVATPDERLPKPFLVIEVSDTSYRRDRGSKLRSYAAAGIQDYWIINLNQHRVEVYRGPVNSTGKRSGWRYSSPESFAPGQEIPTFAYPRVALAVSDFLP